MLPPATDPKAQKRFDNNRVQAAQATTMGQAGQSAFHTNVNRSNGRLQQLMGASRTAGAQPSISQVTTTSSPASTGGAHNGWEAPANQPVMGQTDFSQEETIKNDLDLEYFLSSPAVQQQLSRSRLRRYFQRHDPMSVHMDVASDAINNMMQGT